MKIAPVINYWHCYIATAVAATFCISVLPVRAEEKLLPGAGVLRLEAEPAAITLKHPYAYAQLVLTAQLASGERIDASRMATLEKSSALISVNANGLVRPLADGPGRIKCTLAGKSLEVPVTVTGQKKPYSA